MHWKCCGHPHVVGIYQVFRNSLQFPGESESVSRLLLVLELMDGGELFYRISKQNGFTERQAAHTTMQIALAVQHLHSLNIAHRDLKPENLLYQSKQEDALVKLCDFGFAKMDNGNLTTPQFTPYYVSPEVLEAQRKHRKERNSVTSMHQPYTYDKSCDMWSLGVIIYILICGCAPFYSDHPSSSKHRHAVDKSMRKKIMAGQYKEEWGQVSPQAIDVVKRLLCVDSKERMTIDELVRHPWLTEEAPDTVLNSHLLFTNKAVLKQTCDMFKKELKKMRIIERSAELKPIEDAIIPMLVKRQQKNRSHCPNSTPAVCSKSQVPTEANHDKLKPLRDVIADCLFSLNSSDEASPKLNSLVVEALKANEQDENLQRVLREFEWNDDDLEFGGKVDAKKLAYSIKDVIVGIKNL